MCALGAGKIYSFMMNNLLFEATIWLAGKQLCVEPQLRILNAMKAVYTK